MFYSIKTDHKNNIIISWNTVMTYILFILFLTGILSVLFEYLYLGGFITLTIFGLLIYYILKYGSLIKSIRRFESLGKLHYVGSKYSLKNPLSIVISKDVIREELINYEIKRNIK